MTSVYSLVINTTVSQNNVQTTSLPKTLGKYFCFIKSRKISLNVVVGSIMYVRVWLSTSSAIQTLSRQIDISTLYLPLSNSDIIFTHTTPPTPFAYFLPRYDLDFSASPTSVQSFSATSAPFILTVDWLGCLCYLPR